MAVRACAQTETGNRLTNGCTRRRAWGIGVGNAICHKFWFRFSVQQSFRGAGEPQAVRVPPERRLNGEGASERFGWRAKCEQGANKQIDRDCWVSGFHLGDP